MSLQESNSDRIKAVIYIAIGVCTLVTIATGIAVQFSSISDHEERIDSLEDLTRIHAIDEARYQKDIEQIKKDIARLVEEQKAQGDKADEMLRILLGRN